MIVPARSFAWPSFILLCVGFAAGCDRDTSRSDALGVLRETESGWPQELRDSVPAWTVGDSTLLLLGGTDSSLEETFYRVRSVFIHSNDDVVVADEGSSQVRVFDASGRFRRSFGERGGGPEEFAALMGAGTYRGDSIYTFDPLAQRVGIWAVTGELGRSFFLPQELGPRFQSAHPVAGDRFVVVSNIGNGVVPPGASSSTDSSVVVILSPAGRLMTERARVAYLDFLPLKPLPGVRATVEFSPPPFAPEGRYAVQPDRFDYAWSSDWRVTRFQLDGSTIDTLVFDLPLRPLTREMFDEWMEQRLEQLEQAGAGDRRSLRRHLRDLLPILPENLPAFDRMLTDDDGHLWLRRFRFLDEPDTDWIVISPEGSIAARTSMDGYFEPMHIATHRIAGVQLDDMGREQVVVKSLNRSAMKLE